MEKTNFYQLIAFVGRVNFTASVIKAMQEGGEGVQFNSLYNSSRGYSKSEKENKVIPEYEIEIALSPLVL